MKRYLNWDERILCEDGTQITLGNKNVPMGEDGRGKYYED